MARTISTPRKIPPTDRIPTVGVGVRKSPQKKRKPTKTSKSSNKCDDTIVKIAPSPPPSYNDVQILYKKGGVPLQNEINEGSMIDFLDSACHEVTVTVTASEDVAGGGLVNDDTNMVDEDSQDMNDGTTAQTCPAVVKGRRSLTLPPGHSSSATVVGVGVLPPPRPRQNHHRTSENGKEEESPGGGSLLHLDDIQPATAKKGNEGQLKAGQKVDIEIVAAKIPPPRPCQNQYSEEESPGQSPHDSDDKQHANANETPGPPGLEEEEMAIVTAETTHIDRQSIPIPPSDEKGGLVGPLLVPAKKRTKRKRGPSKKRTVRGGTGITRNPKHFSCYFCQKTTRTKQNLETHLRTHTGEKPFKCHLCKKEWNQKQGLEAHIRRHLKEKPYKCSHTGCSSSFTTGTELKTHSRVHSGERPFKCPFCGNGFSQKSSLNTHIRSHRKNNYFKCLHPGCSSYFVTGGELKQHSRVHSGGKPYVCLHPGCGNAFSQASSLRIHSLRIHSGQLTISRVREGASAWDGDQ